MLARLASLYLMHGDVAQAEQALDSARQGFSNANPLVSPAVYQAEIELALTQDNPVRALQMANEFCAHIARLHTRNESAGAEYLKGEALRASARNDEARTAYEESQHSAESLGQRRLLWLVLLRLSEIAAQRGQAEEAAAMRRQAREIVTDIAAHTPVEWRASFRALPTVRAALEEL